MQPWAFPSPWMQLLTPLCRMGHLVQTCGVAAQGPDMKELSKSLARHRIMLDATQQDMSSPVSLQGGPTTQHEAQQQHQQRQWQQHASGEVQSAPSDHDSSEAMSPVSQHIGGIQWHQPPPNGSQETRYRPGWTAADHMSVLRNQGQAGGLCATTYPTSSQPQVARALPPSPLPSLSPPNPPTTPVCSLAGRNRNLPMHPQQQSPT